MDPQQRFIASTLQGALDADVLTLEDLYKHLPAEVLAEHIAPDILWSCLTEGMATAGLGFGGTAPMAPESTEEKAEEKAAPPPLPSQTPSAPPPSPEVIVSEEVDEDDISEEELVDDEDIDEVSPEQVEESVDFDVTEGDVDELLEAATGGEEELSLNGDDVIEDLPPLPVDEALIVEEVNWGDDQEK